MPIIITDEGSLARALMLPIDPRLKRLLIERRDQLGGNINDVARFIVVQVDDTLEAVEQALGFVVLSDPELSFGCEWVWDHKSFYEVVWILTDDGFAHVVIVPQGTGIDPDLLRLCALHVTDEA